MKPVEDKKVQKLVYNCDKKTGEHVSVTHARPDPMHHDRWLLPRYATWAKPPDTKKSEVAVMVDGNWQIKEDHRGTKAWEKASAKEVTIVSIGPIPSPIATDEPPRFAIWDGTKWTQDAALVLADKKRRERAELAAKMPDTITICKTIDAILRLAKNTPAAGDDDIITQWQGLSISEMSANGHNHE